MNRDIPPARPDMTPEQIRDAAAYVRSLIHYPRDPAGPTKATTRQQDVLDRARARIDRERAEAKKETP